MSGKIGILWPGTVDSQDYKLPEDVRVISNVQISNVAYHAGELVRDGADILMCVPTMAGVLTEAFSVPIAVAHVNYIDILETIFEAEKQFYPRYQRAALLFHNSNPIQLERILTMGKFQLGHYRYDSNESLEAVVDRIIRDGYPLVISGLTATQLAQKSGLDVFPMRYRSQSLASGIQKAREILTLIQSEQLQLERLRTVLNIIPDGILVTDRDGTVTMCNAKMSEFVGLPQEQLNGRPVSQLLEDESWQQVYEEGVPQNHLPVKYHKRGYFSTRRPVIENGQLSGAVGIMQEVNRIQDMERQYRYIQNQGLTAKYHFSDIVGDSPVMRAAVEQARRYAGFDATVLIEGETGTGKEVFAQSIHNDSARNAGPFVAVNCAAIAENLLESELMGYEEGAFTGAKRGGKAGLFERAHNGTIFLDEINQMPLSLQPKILRVIQERVLTRVGGVNAIPINVRIIAASNENLAKLVASGAFRSDLYYRLNVLALWLPPLRERQGDIPLLARHFLSSFRRNAGSVAVDPNAACQAMAGYPWPGNVRELQNYLERCSILGMPAIVRQFFPGMAAEIPTQPADRDTVTLRLSSMAQMERELIQAAVRCCGGNQSKAALLLDINRNTIRKKLSEDPSTTK